MISRFFKSVVLVASLATSIAWAQTAGRVLAVAGEATIERAGMRVAAVAGAEVRSGDVLTTGTIGNLQVLFIDASILSLREASRFAIENFRYQPGAADNAAAFSLTRGGLRKFTGILAKQHPNAYRVRSRIATIGVRGTHYALRLCEDDCTSDNGTKAANGLYGGVFEGAVTVSNDTPLIEVGANEFFYVADRNTPPALLLGQPALLADRLVAMAKNATRKTDDPVVRNETTTPSANTTEPTSPELAGNAPYSTTENRNAAGTPASANAPVGFAFALSLPEINGAQASYNGGARTPFVNLAVNGSGPTQTLQSFTIADSTTVFLSARAGSGPTDMQGFDPTSGAPWGRWSNGTVTSTTAQAPQVTPGTYTPGGGVHFIYASLTPLDTLAAKVGTFQFVDQAGTTPTASNGQIATAFNFGPMNINFTNRTGVLTSVSMTFPTSQWNWSNVPITLLAQGSIAHFDSGNLSNFGSCVGAGCGPVQGANTVRTELLGTFFGPSGQFLGMTFMGNSGGTTGNVTVGAVRLYRCPTCP
jgi:hypothetical protein